MLYLFFLGLLFTNTGHAATFALPLQGKSQVSHQQSHTGIFSETRTGFSLSKTELLFDNDNDENEAEPDFPDTVSASENLSLIQYFIAALNAVTITSSTTTGYYKVNTSRLPRHNYISLQVFRI